MRVQFWPQEDIDSKNNKIYSLLVMNPTYEINQEYGQRKFHKIQDDEPDIEGTEIFCNGIPPDCFEDELVPYFSQAGDIKML